MTILWLWIVVRWNCCIRTYLSFIEHVNSEIVCILEVISYKFFDTVELV